SILSDSSTVKTGMPPKKKAEFSTENEQPKKSRWEENVISPSKCPSPTRYDESQSISCRDKDNAFWKSNISELTGAQISEYLQLTKHLKQDTSLAILRDSGHDIAAAVEFCNECEEFSDLSLLEVKVLLVASPAPHTVIDGELSESTVDPENHILNLLSHVDPTVIRNHYYRIGREPLCVSPSGWLPNLDRLERAGLVSEDVDSPLYKKPGGRALRSSAFVAEAPKKLGRRDNLSIAMVGFDQKKKMREEDESFFGRRSFPLPPSFNRTANLPIDRRSSLSSIKNRRPIDSKRRGRSLHNPPLIPSPLVVPPSSSSISPPANRSSILIKSIPIKSIPRKTRTDPLAIDMNWSPIDNGTRARRPSDVQKENGIAEAQRKNKESSSMRAALTSGSGFDSIFGASVSESVSGLKSFAEMCIDITKQEEERQRMEVNEEGGRRGAVTTP
ncbi:hypothetical protein PENTCL1PPCAC_14070, partial [Pristionchus entomophagus]